MLISISVVVIAATVVVAAIFFIPVLIQVRRTAGELEKLSETIRTMVTPFSHDLTIILQETKDILSTIHRQVDRTEESINVMRDVAIGLRNFQKGIKGKIEGHLLELTGLKNAVSCGVSTFFHQLRR
jgi:uncharacterized protein YoxC